MHMYDLLHKKRAGQALSPEEVRFFITGFTRGDIPDYQASALLMAICFAGMTDEETACLTREMAASGDQMDLRGIHGPTVDKHSTGGVGDKTTLIVATLVAACGGKVAKMSGRGLGHTGGTIDKLEAIPGFETQLSPRDMVRQAEAIGLCIAGQTGNLAPADKKLYALRDVTATVDSLPLIASSVMSKKLAAGCDHIVLDVKMGSGAFMKTHDEAAALARTMVAIGQANGRDTCAVITDMDRPLGRAIGNAVEVVEAIETLRGNGPADLTDVCLTLAAQMLHLCHGQEAYVCRRDAEKALKEGRALAVLRRLVEAQHGDPAYIDDPSRFPPAACQKVVLAKRSGYITHMDTREIGMAAMELGAGRETKDASIDPAAGMLLEAKPGDFVREGQPLARLLTNDGSRLIAAERRYRAALTLGDEPPAAAPLIVDILSGFPS